MAEKKGAAPKSGGLMSKKVAGIPVPILALGGLVVGILIYKKIKGSSSRTAASTTPAAAATPTDTGAGTGTTGSGGGYGGGGPSGGGGFSATLAALQAEIGALQPGGNTTNTTNNAYNTNTTNNSTTNNTYNNKTTTPTKTSSKPTAKAPAVNTITKAPKGTGVVVKSSAGGGRVFTPPRS